MNEPIKLLLVDDHPVVRAGLVTIFESEPGIKVVGEAQDSREAIEKAAALAPDVILMDIYMSGVDGLNTISTIKQKTPGARIVFLTVSQREEDLFRALRLGAAGYLLKSSSAAEVVDAVKKAAAGETVLSPALAGKLAREFQQQSAEVPLSSRESEVLDLIGSGCTNTEISKQLFISESTVRTYLRRLFEKLHVHNRIEAATYAKSRPISPPEAK